MLSRKLPPGAAQAVDLASDPGPAQPSPAPTGDAAAAAAATDPDSVTERVPLPPVGWGLAFSDVHNRWFWRHLEDSSVVLLNSDTEEAVESEAAQAQQAAQASAPVSPDATSSPEPGLNIKGDRRGKGKKMCAVCDTPNAARQKNCVECGHDFFADKQKKPQAPEQEQEAASAERDKTAKEDVEESTGAAKEAAHHGEKVAKEDVEEPTSLGTAKEAAPAAKNSAESEEQCGE